VPEQRLPYSVTDDRGEEHQGELRIARMWGDLEIDPNAAFTIVLLEEPLNIAPVIGAKNVVVCSPAIPVRIPNRVAEPRPAYAGASPAPPRLTKDAITAYTIAAYARGRLYAAQPLSITPREIFAAAGAPRLERLVLALDLRPSKAQDYWDEAARILAWPDQPAGRAQPAAARSRLRALLRTAPTDGETLERLRRLAGGAAPADVAASPAALADAIAYARCLATDTGSAHRLALMQSYAEQAIVTRDREQLAVDRAFVREQLSFVTLLQQPNAIEYLSATFDMFRDSYAAAYAKHHASYWRAFGGMERRLDDIEPAARALAQLNALRALGKPVGEDALATYDQLRAQDICAETSLSAALRSEPRCPRCGVAMDESPAVGEAQRVVREINAALATQQSRLASEAVRRILARGGSRLDQFLQIVQAADSAALASVLDDELLTFLSGLLAEPVVPTPEALDLFEQLARAYPTVDDAQVDAVVATLRDLLTEALAAQRNSDPAAPAAFRLASQPPS
jgi:hypothetical protein